LVGSVDVCSEPYRYSLPFARVSIGVLSAALTHPFDTIKSCMQVSLRRGGERRGGNCLRPTCSSHKLTRKSSLRIRISYHSRLSFNSAHVSDFLSSHHTHKQPTWHGRFWEGRHRATEIHDDAPNGNHPLPRSGQCQSIFPRWVPSLTFIAPPSSNCYCSNSIPHSLMLGLSLLHRRVS
jgi:hypothetical protein